MSSDSYRKMTSHLGPDPMVSVSSFCKSISSELPQGFKHVVTNLWKQDPWCVQSLCPRPLLGLRIRQPSCALSLLDSSVLSWETSFLVGFSWFPDGNQPQNMLAGQQNERSSFTSSMLRYCAYSSGMTSFVVEAVLVRFGIRTTSMASSHLFKRSLKSSTGMSNIFFTQAAKSHE